MAVKMAIYQPLFVLVCVISGKPDQIARPLLLKKNVQLQAGIYHEKCQLDQIQNV